MIKKTVLQGIALMGLFIGIWALLQRADWVTIFKIEKISSKTEQKLGDLFWDIFRTGEKVNTNPFVENTLDSLITAICTANNINKAHLKFHVLDKDEVNAFALPNKRLVIYSGLILEAENQEELSGVISHEIAHIELRHVMKKLIKEVGLSVLISMTTGGGADIVRETVKMLSSTAFDRNLEREADIKAVDYLVRAKIDPEPFANFLYRLSERENDIMRYLSWISTHPDSQERAEYIIEYGKDKLRQSEQVVTQETWEKLKENLRGF